MQGWGDGGFTCFLISYLSVTRENKLSAQVLALMGFHVRPSPVGFLSPSAQLQEHTLVLY